ncbi:MAG: ATP-binding protein [Spirulina sp. SIO3F2]|nr:ATP-binding protein [Spirulina sp. SIO3F2]
MQSFEPQLKAVQPNTADDLQALYSAIAWIRSILTTKIDPTITQTPFAQTPPHCCTLQALSTQFGLTAFEENVLLLCAAMELEPHCAQLCAQISGNPQQTYPTFGLALSLFAEAAWDVLATERPLRYWQLLQIDPHTQLTHARIALDQRIFLALLGVDSFDATLADWIKPIVGEPVQLPPSQAAIATQIQERWVNEQFEPMQLCHPDLQVQIATLQTVCKHLNFQLHKLWAQTLPTQPQALQHLKRRWQREAILSRSVLLIDCMDAGLEQQTAIAQLIQNLTIPVMLCTPERQTFGAQPLFSLEIPKPSHPEKRQLWEQHLGRQAAHLNGHLDPLVSQFNLNSHTIQAACHTAQAQPPEALPQHLWQYCRTQARPQLDRLAQRIHCTATWDELMLPEREKGTLHDVAVQVQQQAKVYEQWGFAHKSTRGLGITALFAGPSGTGKTMAAEVLAQEFQLDLYRIDLSAVSSKYIGETEKNLRQIFDAAESGGAVLLFDEADALFGKRTQVKDSHDRHANLEVSYLLQRMEAYQGLAILTTNLKDSIDQAFIRRLRFIVNFPYPSPEVRGAIWEQIFPSHTPTQGLDYQLLGQLDMAGGNIRAIALNSAFIAADADEPVQMKHILQAAQAECTKIGRSLTRKEVQYWLD